MGEQRDEAQPLDGDEAGGREEKARQRRDITDFLRKTLYSGLGAIFASEEGIRKLANDFSLPKDMAVYLIGQAQSTKNELFRIFSSETRRFLEGLRLSDELRQLLASMSIEVKTQVRFIPNDEQVKPHVKHRVRVKRGSKAKAVEPSDLP